VSDIEALRVVVAECIAPWHACYEPEDWCREKNRGRAATILAAIDAAGYTLVHRETVARELAALDEKLKRDLAALDKDCGVNEEPS
jgi:hypothetical protein